MDENEFFRFPPLPKEEPPIPKSRGDTDEESGEGKGGSTGIDDMDFIPEWAEFQANMLWKFDFEKNAIVNKNAKKMIKLENLDSIKKITTTLNHFENYPEMDYHGMVFALQKAVIHNYQMSLSQLIETHPENEVLKWDRNNTDPTIKNKIESIKKDEVIKEQKQQDLIKEKKKDKADHGGNPPV